jgi:hypothetical protein
MVAGKCVGPVRGKVAGRLEQMGLCQPDEEAGDLTLSTKGLSEMGSQLSQQRLAPRSPVPFSLFG